LSALPPARCAQPAPCVEVWSSVFALEGAGSQDLPHWRSFPPNRKKNEAENVVNSIGGLIDDSLIEKRFTPINEYHNI